MRIEFNTKFSTGDVVYFKCPEERYGSESDSEKNNLIPVVITGMKVKPVLRPYDGIHSEPIYDIDIKYACESTERNEFGYAKKSWSYDNDYRTGGTSELYFQGDICHESHPRTIVKDFDFDLGDTMYVCRVKEFYGYNIHYCTDYDMYSSSPLVPIQIMGWIFTEEMNGFYEKETDTIRKIDTKINWEIQGRTLKWSRFGWNTSYRAALKTDYKCEWDSGSPNNYNINYYHFLKELPKDYFEKTIKYYTKGWHDEFNSGDPYLKDYMRLAIFTNNGIKVTQLAEEYKRKNRELTEKRERTKISNKVKANEDEVRYMAPDLPEELVKLCGAYLTMKENQKHTAMDYIIDNINGKLIYDF